jgi:hypothetical protein
MRASTTRANARAAPEAGLFVAFAHACVGVTELVTSPPSARRLIPASPWRSARSDFRGNQLSGVLPDDAIGGLGALVYLCGPRARVCYTRAPRSLRSAVATDRRRGRAASGMPQQRKRTPAGRRIFSRNTRVPADALLVVHAATLLKIYSRARCHHLWAALRTCSSCASRA